MNHPITDEQWEETLAAVRACGGNLAAAARVLGIVRQSLDKRIISRGMTVAQVREMLRGLQNPECAVTPRECADVARNAQDDVSQGQREPPMSHSALSSSVVRDRLGRIADLLESSGIPIEELGRIERIKLKAWQGLTKDENGNARVTDMHGEQLVAVPAWADGPAWPVIQQADAVMVTGFRTPDTPNAGWQVAVVLPDIQIGFYWLDGALVPTHDERALAVALDVVEACNPDQIVMVGDNLDLPEMSRYRKHPVFQRTTQAAIDRAARLCASLRARVRPECRIIWIAGNHEERLPNYLIDNAHAAFGLKRGESPKAWPVMSVPFLCRFDDHGVEFLAGYPASVWWINDHLSVIHGNKVRSGGSTAHAYLPEIRHSVIYGHVHRREFAAVTRLTKDGPRTYHAACFGALCRIDGSVPGSASGYDLDGQPVKAAENWQQGVGIVEYVPGDGDFTLEAVEIWNGRTRWRGRSIVATNDVEAT